MSVAFINSFLGGAVASGTLASPRNRFLFEYIASGRQDVGIEVNQDGRLYKTTFTDPPQYLEKWKTAGLADAFDVRATLISGSAPLGSAVGSWLNVNAHRAWYVSRSVVGITTSKILLEWRDASTLVVGASCEVEMSVENGT